jgi:flagellar biosynthesis component FlhA
MLDAAPHTREPRDLAEAVRRVAVPQQFRRDGVMRLRPLLLAPAFDAELARMWSSETGLAPDPQTARHVRDRAAVFAADLTFAPHTVVVSATLRPLLAEFFERLGPRLDVYAFSEIPPTVALEPAAVLDATA